jgi:hypothetical protein
VIRIAARPSAKGEFVTINSSDDCEADSAMAVAPDSAVPANKTGYTESDWEEESYRLFMERSDPAPCPQCGRTGFFGPRAADPGLKFRACRFCGFWQAIGEKSVQFRPTAHACDEWPECAKAPYVWWVHPDQKQFDCPYCGQVAKVESHNAFERGSAQLAPVDDPDHPWRKVPQGRPYSYYLRFWENWPVTKGRVIL